ncbi:MAG TPA: nicotinamide-nucleotide amidohydrolase family protein [Humisphaera sp.]|nr:nicotinamide-nucleotide amidohydrolase family protein [Humisphaera sp.]
MQAIILSIGDELVLGQTVDTNSAWLSQQLAAVGCSAVRHITVGDDKEGIRSAIYDALGECDTLIISGGIGPTQDDLTRQALAKVADVELELNEVWLAKLEDFFKSRGREMPAMNMIQAMIPQGARMIENTCGTAAGIDMTLRRYALPEDLPSSPAVSKDYMEQMFGPSPYSDMAESTKEFVEQVNASGMNRPTRVFVLPGVPKEMKAMFTLDVLPHIKAASSGAVILSRTLHTFGLGESAVAEKLGDLMRRDRNPSVGTTVSNGIVSLRINARFPSREEASKQLEETTAACEQALGDLIFGRDEQTLQEVVAALLFDRNKAAPGTFTVTTAESCTGGLLAKMLTDVAGSSAYFKVGFITYANEAKTDLLKVDPTHIAGHGAVSVAVAREMAVGSLERGGADVSLAISGIAGPGGGTPEKPVGTVCIALAQKKSPHPEANARTFILTGDREMIRDRAAKMALTMLRFHLIGKPLPF